MAPEGFPFLYYYKIGADWGMKDEMAMIGHFQKTDQWESWDRDVWYAARHQIT